MTNDDLIAARVGKNDEFFTQLSDIKAELNQAAYDGAFDGKTVLCNCNDSESSNFFKYFHAGFRRLGLKELIAVSYGDGAYKIERTATKLNKTSLIDHGDFRSPECLELLERADIVCTNPPFSLFRDYMKITLDYGKQYLIIGNVNEVACKELFPLFQNGKLWFGSSIHSGDRMFKVPHDYTMGAAGCGIDEGKRYIQVKGVRWYTNLGEPQYSKAIPLSKSYLHHETDFPKYRNYDAIEVSKTEDIPYDYDEEMGVPITFVDKYNPEQFKIIGLDRELAGNQCLYSILPNGERKNYYTRIIIRRGK